MFGIFSLVVRKESFEIFLHSNSFIFWLCLQIVLCTLKITAILNSYRDGKIEVNVFVVVSIFGVTVSMHLFKYITCVCNCSIVISNIQFKEILFMNLLWFSLFILLYHTQLPLLRKHDFFSICLLSLSISHFHEYLWNVTICFHFFALINW